MATLGPTQQTFRMSSGGVMVRLRVNDVGGSWITIDDPRRGEPYYADIPESEIGGVLARFQAIDGDPGRFEAFVSALKS